MISPQFLICESEPREPTVGRFALDGVVISIRSPEFPVTRELWGALFVPSDGVGHQTELMVSVALLNGKVRMLSSTTLQVLGSGDFTFSLIHWNKLEFPEPGSYRFALNVKDPQTGKWAEPPISFWMVHAAKSDEITA
jgi:hypothetical protein